VTVAVKVSSSRARTIPRRIGAENSRTRAALLDAAEQLMRNEGYAAVSSRRLGEQAKLKPQLVHYYFRTMDDLFLALWQRFSDRTLESQVRALTSSRPLTGFWDFSSNVADTSLAIEFMALAHHRKLVRNAIARQGEKFRRIQVEALSRIFDDYGLKDTVGSPEILSVLVASVSRVLVMEADLGISAGHASTIRFVERWLKGLEGSRPRRKAALKPQTRRSRPVPH
jgi:AcrR family transcriptional regulator